MADKVSRRRSAKAFTLIELVITLSVMAILIGWGFPSVVESIRNNRVAAQNVELVSLLNFTKSEAVRRNTSVPILLIPTEAGWDAIVTDPGAEANVEGCVPGQLRCASNTRINLAVNTAELIFNNRGYIREAEDAWAAETLYLQHESCSGQNQRYRIDIMPTGQISSCRLPCDSTAACPP